MSFSFKFGKVKAPSKLQPVKLSLTDVEEKTEAKAELVTSIDDNEVKTVNQAKEKSPLVIPLIKNNVWRRKRDSDGKEFITASNSEKTHDCTTLPTSNVTKISSSSSDEQSRLHSCANDNPDLKSLDEVARRELISEAKSLSEVESSNSKRVIPLLLQNKVPDGFEEDDNFDVSLRPDKPSAEDYEKVPVSEFGMAMLRGMGFDEKKAVSVAPVEVTIRYKGLGLGADAPPPPPSSVALSSSSLSIDAKRSKSDR